VITCCRYENEISRFYLGHQTLLSEQLHGEISLRNLQWKMYRKQRCVSRLNMLKDPNAAEVSTAYVIGLVPLDLMSKKLVEIF